MQTATTSASRISRLSSQERRFLATAHPDITDRAALISNVDDTELLAEALALVKSFQRRRERMEKTIEAMLPAGLPSKVEVLQARRSAEARETLLQEFGALTSAEVADLAGSKARNRAALANRWRKEGQIFAVTHRGQIYYPGFQFGSDGRPVPVVAEVLRLLNDRSEGWPLALWFDAANGWLDGARPVDLLISEPNRVIEAARSEAEELVF